MLFVSQSERVRKMWEYMINHWWKTGDFDVPPYLEVTQEESEFLLLAFTEYLHTRAGLKHMGELLRRNVIDPFDEGENVPLRVWSNTIVVATQHNRDFVVKWGNHRIDVYPGTAYFFNLILETGGPITESDLMFLTLQGIRPTLHGGFPLFYKDPKRNEAIMATIKDKANLPEFLTPLPESYELAQSFMHQLITDANESGNAPCTGVFVLQNPAPDLLPDFKVEQIRLVIKPTGLWISLVNDIEKAIYAWGWWSPEDDNLLVDFGGVGMWLIRVICAAIWRDACVIKHKAFTVREHGGKQVVKAHGAKINPTILPRTIYTGMWGSREDEAAIERVQRRAHAVRAHYRHSKTCTERAVELASEYDYPPPPVGFTFVSPHTRGTGEIDQSPVRPVVCRGLLTAAVALNRMSVK